MASIAAATSAFHAIHKQRFSYDEPSVPVEIVALRLTAIGRLANRIGDQARFAAGLAAARAGLRPPPRPLVPRPISFASTRLRSA